MKILLCFLSAFLFFQQTICIESESFDKYLRATDYFYQKSEFAEAMKNCQKAIMLDPNDIRAKGLYAKILSMTGKTEQSIVINKQILSEAFNLMLFLSLIYAIQQKTKEAEILLNTLTELAKDNKVKCEILCQFKALYKQEKHSQAKQYLIKVLQLKPDSLHSKLEQAKILFLEGDVQQTEKILFNLLSSFSNALNFLAMTYAKQKKYKNAITLLDSVIIMTKNFWIPLSNKGIYNLFLGNLKEGFKEYEHRNPNNCKISKEAFEKPVWRGQDLQGKKILVYDEQGAGDTFQFIRYAKMLNEKGAIVSLRLRKLFLKKYISLFSFIDEIVSDTESLPDFDYKIRLLSLPFAFQISSETVPNKVPYLSADKELQRLWKEKIKEDKSFKIGICWNSNTVANATASRNILEKRSMKLIELKSIFDLDNVSIYCLQVGAEREIQDSKLPLISFGTDFDKKHGSFMDTAALIKSLDLVLTIDTSVAHLAGGLGIPVWVMLQYSSDWRWMLDRNDSPWYPTMKLFRQPKPGDWDSVISDVRTELLSKINRK